MTQYYVNRVRYKGGSPTLGASSGIINNAVINGHDLYDDNYDPTPPAHDYSLDYFTIESLEDGNNVKFWHRYSAPVMYYSKNLTSWSTVNLPVDDLNITLNAGEKLYLKAANNATSQNMALNQLKCSKASNVYGNIMSLLYGDNFVGQTTLPSANIFSNDGISGIFRNSVIIDASNLVLPATTLTSKCYYGMFQDCTSLIYAPKTLSATTLADNCYKYMFYGCTSLVNAPEILATTLAQYCCDSMFFGCTSLVNAPSTLPATTLVTRCYQYMFRNCTSLVTAPELPATTLATNCYLNMFQDCTSLVTAPELPATTLVANCYNAMFYRCTSLVTAPELPAVTLLSNCYRYMFSGCSKLSYIKALFTTTPSWSYTENWTDGVAATGTFIKNSAATWNVTGINGVPTGWTVQTAAA